jgi:excisionase family DNA binding protein
MPLTLNEIETLTRVEKVAYTINEAMAATGLGRTRIYEEIKHGRLKAVKAGKRTLIPVKSITAWTDQLPEA